jgi:hypothetical protein
MGELLGAGASVLVTDIDVVYVQDPFRYLHRDSDLEGTTDGWDAATAYGWTEQVDPNPDPNPNSTLTTTCSVSPG